MKKKIKVLISACLLGDNVKYSGGNNLTPKLVTLLEKYNVDIVKVCPECFGGLPIPRVPSEIKENKVFSKDNRDVTEEFLIGAEKTLKIAKENDVNFAILKERSPSCGSTHIYDGSFSGNIIPGQGITAKRLTEEKIKVFSEENLEEIEKYFKDYYPDSFSIKHVNFEAIGDYYVVETDIIANNSNEDNKNKKGLYFVFREYDFNDYVFSFSKNK